MTAAMRRWFAEVDILQPAHHALVVVDHAKEFRAIAAHAISLLLERRQGFIKCSA